MIFQTYKYFNWGVDTLDYYTPNYYIIAFIFWKQLCISLQLCQI